MRKHLTVAVGAVSLVFGGYLWTNNTAAFAANKNEQPAETITISSNPEEVTIDCAIMGSTSAVLLGERSVAQTSELDQAKPINPSMVTEVMSSDPANDIDCGVAMPIGIDWFELAAQTTGITTTDLLAGLDNGQSIAVQAATKGISKQTIIDVIVAAETTFINQLVADGAITADDAALMATDLAPIVDEFVSTTQSFMPIDDVACTQLVDDASSTEHSDEAIECEVIIGEAIGIDWFELAAQTSAITITDLFTGLDNGQSIAEQAATKGINQQTIIDAIVAAETTFINQLVADGAITADEAQTWLADINQVVSDFVTRTDFMEVAPSEPQPSAQPIAPQR